MICPYCANEKTIVMATVKGLANERFRKCPKCGSYMVLAKDGKTKKCSSKECGYVVKPEKEDKKTDK